LRGEIPRIFLNREKSTLKQNHVPYLIERLKEKFPGNKDINNIAIEMFNLGYQSVSLICITKN